ncbi:NUDIX domain-containing protein [Chitinophaga sp.]|uniref:NUDIX hydrolase n=1 Tax=Chitinophaga sp. TaxID=1869181 RepID=UPI0031D26FF8
MLNLFIFVIMRNIDIEKASEALWKNALPHLSVDCVVFGYHQGSFNVLLARMKGDDKWILPGGYIQKTESIDDAAKRILFERSGAEKVFLEVFGVFGEPNRSEDYFVEYDDNLWHKMRFVTIGYYAVIDQSQVTPVPDMFSDACEWMPVYELPQMVMDHQQIIEKALEKLRDQLYHKPIGYNLLPEIFTLPQLQALYEKIMNQKFNRGNFYRKIMKENILIKQGEAKTGGAHKAPHLYKFDPAIYTK